MEYLYQHLPKNHPNVDQYSSTMEHLGYVYVYIYIYAHVGSLESKPLGKTTNKSKQTTGQSSPQRSISLKVAGHVLVKLG